jgi:hypothetical protein
MMHSASPHGFHPRQRPSHLLPPAFGPAGAEFGSARSSQPVPGLSEDDIRLLNAVAAHQILYGKPSEALALLQLTVRFAPGDPQSLRLLSEAFLATGDAETADAAVAAHEAAVGAGRLAPSDMLRRSRVLAALRRGAEAAEAFGRFLRSRRAAP